MLPKPGSSNLLVLNSSSSAFSRVPFPTQYHPRRVILVATKTTNKETPNMYINNASPMQWGSKLQYWTTCKPLQSSDCGSLMDPQQTKQVLQAHWDMQMIAKSKRGTFGFMYLLLSRTVTIKWNDRRLANRRDMRWDHSLPLLWAFWGQHRRKDGQCVSSLKRQFYPSFERKFDDLEFG